MAVYWKRNSASSSLSSSRIYRYTYAVSEVLQRIIFSFILIQRLSLPLHHSERHSRTKRYKFDTRDKTTQRVYETYKSFRNAILSVKGDSESTLEYFTMTRLRIERRGSAILNSNAVMKNECRVGVNR